MISLLNKSSKEISEDRVTLVESMKTEKILKLLFSVQFFVEKVDEVNANLEEICVKEGIPIITYSNINPKRHLNESRLHINYTGGISVLARNFKDLLTNSD